MKLMGTALMLLAAILITPSFAQDIPGTGFSDLVCVLGVHGSGTFTIGHGEFVVTVEDNGISEPDDIGTATVTIQHGTSSSTHLLTYEDTNEDGELDCGDAIISVT
jgi:hypothetical protein